MRSDTGTRLQERQRGAALLILLALVTVMLIYAVVAGLNRSAGDLAQARAMKTATTLAQAKEALIAYAVTYPEDPSHTANLVPGFLPCPDTGSGQEGVAAGSCGSAMVSQLGRLPWRTLNLDALKDGAGECLWYAVSGTYKNNPNGVTTSTSTSNMMNWDNAALFNVMDADGASFLAGSNADNTAVAVILAPGAVVKPAGASAVQNRSTVAGTSACGGNYTAANYLENASGVDNSVISTSANALSSFVAGKASDTFNDQLTYITRADIWNAIKKRSDFANSLRALTRRAAECVALYGTNNSWGLGDKRVPWASPISLTNYAVNSRYNDANSDFQGRLSYVVNTSKSATNNTLSGNNLFIVAPYCWYTQQELDWYQNWKDHLWYAVAWSHRPSSGRPTSSPCTTCLRVNGAGSYAAVVMFAGEKLATQSRSTSGQLGSMANYLEGRNLSNDPNSGGNGNYQVGAATSTFNDIVYAVDTNLPTVSCYNGTAMVPVPAAASWPPGPYAACP